AREPRYGAVSAFWARQPPVVIPAPWKRSVETEAQFFATDPPHFATSPPPSCNGSALDAAGAPIRSEGRVTVLPTMTEATSSEVEKVLLFVSDARARARRAADAVRAEGAEQHAVQAL